MRSDPRPDTARLLARLLAGEIRLYNEEAVIAGRMREDLSALSPLIETARARYLARYAELDPGASLLRTELATLLAGGRKELLPL